LINNYEFFLKSLDDSIDNCKEITNGGTGCVVPIKIMSEGAGIISLQNLDMKYESSGSVLTTDKFYLTYESGEGVIEKIKGVSLYDAEDGKVIAITTEGLFLPAPFVSDEKLYNLSIGLNPGPSTSVEVLIEPFGGSIYNETTALRAVDEYITFFTDLQSESGALLDLFGLSGDVSNVLDDLQKILIEINSVSSMNLTETEKQEKLENITSGLSDELDGLVKTLPRSVRVVDKVEDVAVVEPSDVLDSMISNGEEERMQVYYHQEDFTVGIVGEYVEVEFFDDSSVEGTIVTKNINGRGSGYSVFESIPNFIATSSEISLDGFSLVESGGFNVYKKDYDSLSGVSYSYFVQGNVVAGLSDLKTVLVPKSGVVAGHDEVAVCGDGKCAVLLVDGEKIYLEDETSCPEDCASKVNWSGIFLVFMIGVLIVVAVAVYLRFLGKGSKKIKSKGVVDKAMLFSSENDEKNLRDYVAKALESGMDREKVNDVLLKRGWSKEQIDYVFGKK